MLTGVEIAGIVLAVIPLCITILENHQAEIQPLKNLLNFHSQYTKSCGDLQVRMQQLGMMMDLLLTQAAIWTDGQRFGSLVEEYNSGVWENVDKQQRLITYLGLQTYKNNFELVLKQIRSDVAGIASILDLGSYGESKGDSQIWDTLKKAKQINDVSGAPSGLSKKKLKTRAKFVFEGGRMEHKLQNLERNMTLLQNTIQNTATLRQIHKSMMTSDQKQVSCSQFPTFDPPLTNIIGHARRLHNALHIIRNCPDCGDKPVNLKLDRRLRSHNNTGHSEGVQFALACELCSKSSFIWKFLEVSTLSSREDGRGDDCFWRRKAADSVTERTEIPRSRNACSETVKNLCKSMSNDSAMRSPAHFHIDRYNDIIRQEHEGVCPSRSLSPGQLSSFVSLGDLFQSPRNVAVLSDPLTVEQSISLGTEIVSAVVQLSATRWIQGVWQCGEMFLPSTDGVIDKSECYVQVTLHPVTPTEPGNTALRREAFVHLATLLIELALQTPIGKLSSLVAAVPNPPMQNSKRITDREGDVAMLETILDMHRGNIQPSFRRAAQYCLTASRNDFADMRSADTQNEMIREMLAPLESDLQNWA